MIDVYQLQQVLLNLITNAEQAMRDSDRPSHRLTVRTRSIRDAIRLEIEDTGTGVPPESLALIFNPFYTTKPTGEGTGLGLSISLGIVGEHGGRIWAENVGGGGTRFCIELPVTTAPARASGQALAPLAAPRPGLRILVTDDEPNIRAAIERFLTMQGYSVATAGSGREALGMVDGGDPFDAILLDIRMPDISGQQIYERWRVERPELTQCVIFLTGDIVSTDLQAFLQGTGRPYLPKPFEFDAILRLLPQRTAA
jgi:CheY-like chemotaxis protein